jgi:hypothetical protein
MAVQAIRMFNTAARIGTTLSVFGQAGFELVSMYDKASNWIAGGENGFMIFKRAVPEGELPDGEWTQVWSVEDVAAAARRRTPTGVGVVRQLTPAENGGDAGWYPDPHVPGDGQRYWDGERWTSDTIAATTRRAEAPPTSPHPVTRAGPDP